MPKKKSAHLCTRCFIYSFRDFRLNWKIGGEIWEEDGNKVACGERRFSWLWAGIETQVVDFLNSIRNTLFVKLCGRFGYWLSCTLNLKAEIDNAVTTQKRGEDKFEVKKNSRYIKPDVVWLVILVNIEEGITGISTEKVLKCRDFYLGFPPLPQTDHTVLKYLPLVFVFYR